MNIKNRIFRLFALFLLIGSSSVLAQVKSNCIIILADDLGYGDIGFTGSTQIKTSHNDALAKAGVICSQGYVSGPVCAPSRVGLLTGRNQPTFGFDNNLPPRRLEQFNPERHGLPVNRMMEPIYENV